MPIPLVDTLDPGSQPLSPARSVTRHVVVVGASGYIGSNLVPELAARNYRVRAVARSREVLAARRWPEVWLGRALIVAVAYGVLNEMQRRVFWAHYVGRCYDLTTGQKRRYPLRQRVVAARLGIEIDEYHARRDVAKACIWAALQGEVALPPSKVVDSTQGGVLPPTAFH